MAFLAAFAAGLTFAGRAAFPLWDDGYLWLQEAAGGAHAISLANSDRPIVGELWGFFSLHGKLWEAGLAAHWVAWFSIGLVTWILWSQLFPTRSEMGIVAASLSLAPILCETQLILVVPVWSGQLGVVLAWVGVLLLLIRPPSRWRAVGYAVAAVLVFCGVLVSEYPVVTALGGAALVFVVDSNGQPTRKSRAFAAILLGSTAVAGYWAFTSIADWSVRPSVNLTVALAPWQWRLQALPFRLLSALWAGSLGDFLAEFGSLRIVTRTGVAAALVGGALALLLVWLVRRKPSAADTATDLTGNQSSKEWRSVLGLALALVVALSPLLLVGRSPEPGLESRLWIPVLPITAALTLRSLIFVLRSRLLSVVVVAFLVGFATTDTIISTIRERERVARWGEALEQRLPDRGLVVAIFQSGWERGAPIPRDYELTARLTMNWGAAMRDRFWAFADLRQAMETKALTGVEVGVAQQPRLHRRVRRLERDQIVSAVLLVQPHADSGLEVAEVPLGEGATTNTASGAGLR